MAGGEPGVDGDGEGERGVVAMRREHEDVQDATPGRSASVLRENGYRV